MSEHPTPPAGFKEACDAVTRVITARHFGKARRLAWKTLDTGKFAGFAQAQFLIALTSNLTNRHPDALAAHERARTCADFTLEWDGDFTRDHALWAIRARHFDEAQRFIEQARQLHRLDDNRMACLLMAEARLRYAQGRYADAIMLHRLADKGWIELGNTANQQWRFNNYIHWLKALIALGHDRHDTEVRQLEQLLTDGNARYGSREHEVRRKLILQFGQRGNVLDDKLQRVVFNLSARR